MIWVGTSGYNYPEWKGNFYPPALPASKILPHYAGRFPTVEINYTFYRAPNERILDGWSRATPERFRLTLKACREVFVYFKHEESGKGPELGRLLMDHLGLR